MSVLSGRRLLPAFPLGPGTPLPGGGRPRGRRGLCLAETARELWRPRAGTPLSRTRALRGVGGTAGAPEGVAAPCCRLGSAGPHLGAQWRAPSSAPVPGEGTVAQPPPTLSVLPAAGSRAVLPEFEEVATPASRCWSLGAVLGRRARPLT